MNHRERVVDTNAVVEGQGTTEPSVVHALAFFPRGGSSQVERELVRQLTARFGWDVTLATGSEGRPGDASNAETFYAGAHVVSVDYTDSMAANADPATILSPTQSSYEKRPDAKDRIMLEVEDPQYRRQVEDWKDAFRRADIEHASILHLNHLTPMNQAVIELVEELHLTNLHVVGTLHGTEMLMLENYNQGKLDHTPIADEYVRRMNEWIRLYERIIVVSPAEIERAKKLFLTIPKQRFVVIAHGVDTDVFTPKEYSKDQQREFWHSALVARPRGQKPGDKPGSIVYSKEQIERLISTDPERRPLLSLGRFTEVKDFRTLLQGYKLARDANPGLPPLVIVGGHPSGEFEDVHPWQFAQEIGLVDGEDFFLAGWYDHDDVPQFFQLASQFIMTSTRELFGLVAAEAMACGVPVITTRSGGPTRIVTDGKDGIHVDVAAPAQVAEAMGQLFRDRVLYVAMRAAAIRTARRRFSWASKVGQIDRLYRKLLG